MEPPRSAGTTVVVVLVELAPSVKNVVEEHAPAHPTVLEDSAVMTVVVATLVDHVPTVKPVMEVFVSEPESEHAETEFVDTTEWEEAVVLANPDKDAEAEFASATTHVMAETVVLHLQSPVQSAHKPAVVLAQMDTLVPHQVFATNRFLVIFQLLSVMVSPTSPSVHHAQLLSLVLPVTQPL